MLWRLSTSQLSSWPAPSVKNWTNMPNESINQEKPLSIASIDSFLSSLGCLGSSPNTLRAYRGDLKALLGWLEQQSASGGGVPWDTWDSLERATAQYLTMNRTKWSPATVSRKLGTFRSFAEHNRQDRFLSNYRRPSQARAKPHPLPEGIEGVYRMLRFCRTPSQRALVALCGLCGLRVSEAVSIKHSDIDLDQMTLRFKGKGDKLRTVPMNADAFNYIAPAYVKAASEGRTLVGITESAARKLITRLGRRAGLKNPVASHDLRATLATQAYDHTKDVAAVQGILGHSNPATTMRYIETKFDSMRAAVAFNSPEV